MEREMRVFGLTLPELFLEDFLAGSGWLLVIFGAAAGIFARPAFALDRFLGGLAVTLAVLSGLTLLMAAAGIRQNRPALDLGMASLGLSALVWAGLGVAAGSGWAILAGVVMGVVDALAVYLRNLGIQARFKPRFFTLRQFETVIQVADTLIDGDGEAALHPIQVAINIDHFMAKLESPITGDIKQTLGVVEWLLPLAMLGRPVPFSSLGTHERRRAVEKVIGSTFPLFKDVARFLKLLACAGYYGSEAGMAQVGYRPFDQRERSRGVDQTPATHPDPFVDPLPSGD